MTERNRKIAAVVLAAGKGRRMKSDLPKVLHEVAGKPMIKHVLDKLEQLGPDKTIVVVGHQAERVMTALANPGIVFVEQTQLLGTGHAVSMTEGELSGFSGDVLVLVGDIPLIRVETIRALLFEHERTDAAGTVLTAVLPDPSGYGRVVRGEDGVILRIVEHNDSTEDEKRIAEINTGTFVFKKEPLFEALRKIDRNNRQGEYYLTDVMKIFLEARMKTAGYRVEDYRETLGINSASELRRVETLLKGELS
jgi:bifunctional UDP-N-acetylglucosamine pyrophosphorylase/glucosamine-1-phosphate N-acetyltransferase